MKRSKTVEVTVCDGCGHDCDYPAVCQECRKNFCYKCRETQAVEYSHSVNFSGSGDGLFCHPCDAKLMARPNRLFLAFLKIARLRAESKSFWEDFQKRSEAAEAELEALQK